MAFYTRFNWTTSSNDKFEIPHTALDIILELLDPNVDYLWEPFPGTGRSTLHMRSRGFSVTNNIGSEDFFESELPKPPEGKRLVLLSNPPYSIKKQIIEHIEYKLMPQGLRSVALFVPASVLYAAYFRPITEGRHLQMVVHTSRVKFIEADTGKAVVPKPSRKGQSGASFDTAWLCLDLCLHKDIIIALPDDKIGKNKRSRRERAEEKACKRKQICSPAKP